MFTWNKTKIVATVGPASASLKVLESLAKAGVDVFRINGAHGTFEEHIKVIKAIRAVAKKSGSPLAIMLDLPGPKIRIGKLKKEPVQCYSGEKLKLVCGKKFQSGDEIPVPMSNLHKGLKKGSVIFMNDGTIELSVLSIKKNIIECKVVAGGELRSHKGVNLPDAKLDIPSITDKDRELVKLAIREKVDFVSLSFVRKASDMLKLRKLLSEKAPRIKIISKIEKPEALTDLDNIIEASDAVMVARGDLGIEMRFNKIPAIQREILLKCHLAGKPTITATQMLESMVNSATPTRAEASDVANAVWEGTDAVMLSEETSIGKYPVAAVSAMAQIALEAEKEMPSLPLSDSKTDPAEYLAQSISEAAHLIAENLHAEAIVTPTRTGRTALFVSKQRPEAQIIAPTTDAKAARQMNLYWGVRPIIMKEFKTVDEMLKSAERLSLKSKYIRRGDTIVITSGAHAHDKNDSTRMIEVRQVGKP